MQGRQSQGNDSLASANGTGRKQRTIPQRPPGMSRIDQPPATPRVARPQRQAPRPTNWRRRLLLLGGAFVVCGLLAWGIGYALFNFIAGINASAGAATTASDFLNNLANRNYDQAYRDLDATITVQVSSDEFQQQAQNDDHCYGSVTNYTELEGSATTQDNTQSYSYTITRSKLSKPYQLHLTLQQDNYGDWKITSYGNDLGPQPPTCK